MGKATKGEQSGEMPLARAAQRLGVSWERAWRLMLTGELVGRQLENSNRWKVTQESVERCLLKHQTTAPAAT